MFFTGYLGPIGTRVRGSDIHKDIGVELLLPYIERSLLRWLGCLIRMRHGRLPVEAFQAYPAGRRPRGTLGGLYILFGLGRPCELSGRAGESGQGAELLLLLTKGFA